MFGIRLGICLVYVWYNVGIRFCICLVYSLVYVWYNVCIRFGIPYVVKTYRMICAYIYIYMCVFSHTTLRQLGETRTQPEAGTCRRALAMRKCGRRQCAARRGWKSACGAERALGARWMCAGGHAQDNARRRTERCGERARHRVARELEKRPRLLAGIADSKAVAPST